MGCGGDNVDSGSVADHRYNSAVPELYFVSSWIIELERRAKRPISLPKHELIWTFSRSLRSPF